MALEGKELKKFLDSSDLKKKRLKILLKNCGDDQCFITYVVAYGQAKKGSDRYAIEVKKIAQLIRNEQSVENC